MGVQTVIGIDHQLPPHVPGRTRTRRWSRLVPSLLLILGTAAALVLLLARRREAKKPSPAPAPVSATAVTAQRGDVGVHLDSIGTVTPIYTASITSQVSGIVVGVHYTEGQHVQIGDALLDVDARPYRAQLMQAEGALERDRNVLAQARMDLERYREAWGRRAIAKQQLDDQEKIVLQAQGTVRNDEGLVAYYRVQVGWCHITAPIAGRVGLRLVDPGNVLVATSAQTLVVVTQLHPITVVFTVPEDDIGRVQARLGAGATLRVDALDRTGKSSIGSGKLLTLNNQVDTTTGTVKARAVFDNDDEKLFPNQFVTTRLLVDTLRGVTLIPNAAIQQNGPISFVYVIQDGVAHLRKVRPGASDRGLTAVDGIAAGDQIATSSFDRLHEGVAVTVPPAAGHPTP